MMSNKIEQWLKHLNIELQGTSDRSCIITSASIIDHLLLEVLRKYFVPNTGADDTLFCGNAPLGSFSSRIEMAYRIGIISKQFRSDLNVLRRMRNDSAHSIDIIAFSDRSFRDRVLCLMKSLKIMDRCPFLVAPPYDSIRGNFIICCILIVSHLDELIQHIGTSKEVSDDHDPLYTATFSEAQKT